MIVIGSAILLSFVLYILQMKGILNSYFPFRIIFGLMIAAILSIPVSIFLIGGWTGLGISVMAVYVLLFCITCLIFIFFLNILFQNRR
ncbi:YesK family protein [Rossellomorea oryzaecorticis]|uniref:YesK family protein n=1 Tax=Rossellomorea oryzaecorticis TaxID=1396505 RepID=UPI003CCAACF1